MIRKVQLPVVGGNRKVVIVPGQQAQQTGTTISEFANQVISLAQLKAALGITTTKGSSGGAAPASLVVGPGLSGGGVLTGAVPLNLLPTPVVWNEPLLPDDWIGSGGSGGGGGTGGVSTLAALSDVSISAPTVGQELTYNGSKWTNQTPPSGAGVGGPKLVQSQFLRWQGPPSSAGTTTLTLGATPTPGNVLVYMATGYDTSSSTFLTLPTGFTRVAYFNANNTEGIMIGIRVVQSGDGTAYTVSGGNGGNGFGMWEFNGALNVTATQPTVTASSTVLTVFDVPAPPNSYNIGLAQTDQTNAYVSMTGATLLFDATSAGTGSNNHPSVFFQNPVLDNVAITWTGTSLSFPVAALVSVQGAPGGAGIPTGSLFASQGMKGAATTSNTASAYQSLILAESTLVAYWPFSDAAGSTTVKDFKGTNNGSLTNHAAEPILFNAPGRIGSTCAYIVNGQFFTNGSVTVNRPVQDDFTLEAWILLSENITGASGTNWYQNEGIIGFDVSGVTNDFGLGLNNGNSVNGGTGNPDVTATSSTNVLDGAWHHIAMTRVKSTGVSTLYLDGVSVGTVTGQTGSLNAATTVQIGGFKGFIADVAAYSSVLTLSDIQAHVAAGSPGSGAAIVSTGSSGGGNITPDTHPTSPTIYDDEFEFGTTFDTAGARSAGAQAWTGFTANTIASTVAQGAAQTITQGSSTSAGAGYAFPVPSGTWTFVWKGFRPAAEVFNLSTWKAYYFGTSGSGNNMLVQSETRNWATGAYTFNSSVSSFSTNGSPAYFMLRFDGTNLIFSWSQTGYNSDFSSLATVAASSWIVTPDHLGFGTQSDLCVDWLRRTA